MTGTPPLPAQPIAARGMLGWGRECRGLLEAGDSNIPSSSPSPCTPFFLPHSCCKSLGWGDLLASGFSLCHRKKPEEWTGLHCGQALPMQCPHFKEVNGPPPCRMLLAAPWPPRDTPSPPSPPPPHTQGQSEICTLAGRKWSPGGGWEFDRFPISALERKQAGAGGWGYCLALPSPPFLALPSSPLHLPLLPPSLSLFPPRREKSVCLGAFNKGKTHRAPRTCFAPHKKTEKKSTAALARWKGDAVGCQCEGVREGANSSPTLSDKEKCRLQAPCLALLDCSWGCWAPV